MSPERTPDSECPHCGSESFYMTGSTLLHLGEKVKWGCAGEDCSYGFVRIGDVVDTSEV